MKMSKKIKKYENLDALKNIIQETISISNLYISEINNADSFLPENLDDFYAEKSNIKFVNIVNGEEKTANEDDLIKSSYTERKYRKRIYYRK